MRDKISGHILDILSKKECDDNYISNIIQLSLSEYEKMTSSGISEKEASKRILNCFDKEFIHNEKIRLSMNKNDKESSFIRLFAVAVIAFFHFFPTIIDTSKFVLDFGLRTRYSLFIASLTSTMSLVLMIVYFSFILSTIIITTLNIIKPNYINTIFSKTFTYIIYAIQILFLVFSYMHSFILISSIIAIFEIFMTLYDNHKNYEEINKMSFISLEEYNEKYFKTALNNKTYELNDK